MIAELETERLLLRRFGSDDLDSMTAMFSDPLSMEHLGGPRSREQCQADLRKYVATWEIHEWGPLAVIRKQDNKLIGRSGIWPCRVEDELELEVGYFIERESWNRGYATEACLGVLTAGRENGLDRIVALIDPSNVASVRVADKSGLVFERATRVDEKSLHLYSTAKR